jgi:hypothetical protein
VKIMLPIPQLTVKSAIDPVGFPFEIQKDAHSATRRWTSLIRGSGWVDAPAGFHGCKT